MLDYQRVLVTGAAGQLGKLTRRALDGQVAHVRLTDIAEMSPASDGEELLPCDLADADGVSRLLEGVDAVVHLGASLNVDDWDATLQINIAGTYNIYESARRAGAKRIVYASSHHAVGMYPVGQRLDADVALRPDSLYGLSKCFGENLARYYWDKYGIESVCLRIGSAKPAPNEARELSTWLSERDYQDLILKCLTAPAVGCTVVYGVSNNKDTWWGNEKAAHLGFLPQDDAQGESERVRQRVESGTAPGAYPRHGGKRAEYGLVPGTRN